jgi:hypothetical protein
MNDQGQLTHEFNSASNEFIEVGICCLDAAEKSICNKKTAASSSTTRSTLTPKAVSSTVTPNNARKSTPHVPPSSKLTCENEDIELVGTSSVDGDTTTSTSSTNREMYLCSCYRYISMSSLSLILT